MNEKSLKALEYYKIIDMLTEYANSSPGKKLCRSLKPYTEYREIIKNQKETSDALTYIRLKGSIRFSELSDITPYLKLLEIGSVLNMAEILKIGRLLNLADKAATYGKMENNEIGGSLNEYFSALNSLNNIRKEISRCIVSDELMADDASPTLYKIRKQIKAINSKIHNELHNILNAHRDYLMDAVITMRNGSYCLPIKSEYKNRVNGIIHDQSSTGSTVFIEPMAIIKMNNDIKELEIEENKEIQLILTKLCSSLSEYISELFVNYNILKHLDFVYAKANLAISMNASEPIFNNDKYIDIKDARHPLLKKDSVVPINISIGKDYDLLIITGPNTGGKTVSLKTVGLFTLMGQAGLHIPAFEGSKLSVFSNVFADIGDEQSIEQSLSTFSSHMKKIVEILNNADSEALCLFDELGAGTDPTEGAALAISILSFLHRMQIRTIATTHYSELKVFALSSEGVENASCEFDIETLRPTYRILIGVPGKSNAFAISKKLGLPDYIIAEAKTHIKKEDESFEDLMIKLEENRQIIEKERIEIEKYKREIESLKRHYSIKDKNIDNRREDIISKAKEEAKRILEEAKETADTTISNINKIASGAGLGKALEKERDTIRNNINFLSTNSKKKKIKNITPKEKLMKLKSGDSVRVISMNIKGTVTSSPNEKGMLFVQMGILRSQVNINDIEIIEENIVSDNKAGKRKSSSSSMMKALNISPEINLIGLNVDDACNELDKYLDDALLSHLDYVRIIHGRGTGALKNGIHAYLKKQNYIKSYSLADFDDGGDAVTIVKFK